MDEHDQEYIAFITNQGLYYHKVMPFGLKNTGATYQRFVNYMFKPLIVKTMEVYVNDMITKSLTAEDQALIYVLLLTFLNNFKCISIPPLEFLSNKFLGFMVTQRGIEVNLTKIRAVLDLKSLWTIKKVQSLTGGITALNRSISQSMKKRHPFTDIRKKKKGHNFSWDSNYEKANKRVLGKLTNIGKTNTQRNFTFASSYLRTCG